eukprot:2232386-Amphidinium_carterae.1
MSTACAKMWLDSACTAAWNSTALGIRPATKHPIEHGRWDPSIRARYGARFHYAHHGAHIRTSPLGSLAFHTLLPFPPMVCPADHSFGLLTLAIHRFFPQVIMH